MSTHRHRYPSRTSHFLTWISVFVLAAALPVVGVISEIGSQHAGHYGPLVSFANLLFAGNFCALIAMTMLYRKELSGDKLRRRGAKDWLLMIVMSLVTAVAVPVLIIFATQQTTVTNIILAGRIEPFVVLFFSALLIREKVDPWHLVGTLIAGLGVAGSMALAHWTGFRILGEGEMLVAGAALLTAFSSILIKRMFGAIPLGLFLIVRSLVASIVFLAASIWFFGPLHLADLARPELLVWLGVYGPIVVMYGQLLWYGSTTGITGAQATTASFFVPISALLLAFLLLGEPLDWAVEMAAAFMLLGVGLSLLGDLKRWHTKRDQALELEGTMLFKGS